MLSFISNTISPLQQLQRSDVSKEDEDKLLTTTRKNQPKAEN